MTWNPNISEAPLGKNVTVTRTFNVKGVQEKREFTERVKELVWLAHNGAVFVSYWVEPTNTYGGHWCGLSSKETPLAWHPYIRPEYPSFLEEVAA